ncbi:sentrin-specific protease 8 isoform X1 [Callithrix jacchus]|uniref:sentrin-specific protease 8 isoform X1 n=1 Tax=Callithrix jacchus TaxID=9483 RepID=UPI0023DD2A8F|nr:sentrin-specific protease 8 isoform X1 [Callithrix jacchus]XP_054096440.1 sentrin-specific protease 8 isoform X1 [Callithrix jacchus]
MGSAGLGDRERISGEARGPEWCPANGRYGGWGLPGIRDPDRVFGRLSADQLAGRLCWGGAGRPDQSQRARLRRGPGRAVGPLGAWAGLTSGSAAVATAAPSSSAEAASHLRPQGRAGDGSRGRDHRRSDGSGRVGPAASGSGRAAAAHPPPCQSDSARPGQAHPPPHPAQRARVGPPPQPLRPPLPVQLLPPPPPLVVLAGPYSLNSHRQPSPRPLSASARASPTPRTRPRPARLLGCRRAGARALTSHAPYCQPGSAPPCPAPARDGIEEYSLRLRGPAPFPTPQAAPPKFFCLTLRQSGKQP